MLQTILRRNSAKCMAIRGGHGWDRPDVPLLIPYQHKRRVDVFDSNLWFYCGVMPEYFINQNEAYLHSAFNAGKFMILDGRYLMATLLSLYFVVQVFQQPREWNIQPDLLSNPLYNHPKRVQQERPHMVKHFVGLSTTGDQGVVRITPGEKTSVHELQEIYEAQNKHVQQMNAEGKAFIERIELEAQQIVKQRHGLTQASHHH